jgi:hypothetical protein
MLGAMNSQTMLLADTELEQDWKLATELKKNRPLRGCMSEELEKEEPSTAAEMTART